MRRATENQGNARPFTEYFSPRNDVKDQHPPHFTTFLQETPMKSFQLPKHLDYPPPRRALPIQSPELYHRDRHAPLWHPPHPSEPIRSFGFVSSSPANLGSSGNRFHAMQGGNLGLLQHHHHETPGFYGSFAPVSPTSSSTVAYRSNGVFHPASPPFVKDLSDHSPSVHMRRGQGTEFKDTLSYSGSKNATAQRQASNKDQSNDGNSYIPAMQLERLLSPASITRKVHDVFQRPLSDSEHQSLGDSQRPARDYQPSPSTQSTGRSSGSSLCVMHSPVAPSQDQQPKRTPASEISIPVVDLNCSSLKRRREFEDCGSAKKPCIPGINSGKAHPPKSTVAKSLSTSLLPQPSAGHSSDLELSPETTDSHLCTDPTNGQPSHCVTLSSTLKPTQSSCSSLSPKPCLKRQLSMGAKQAYINSTQNHTVKLIELRSPSEPSEECLKKRSEDIVKSEKLSPLLSSEVPQKVTGSSSHVQSGSHHSGHTHRGTSVLPVKTLSRSDLVEESRKSDSSTPKPASKTNSGSLSCRPGERNKTACQRRLVEIADDINDLFTPDPTTYIISNGHKTVKPKMDVLKSPPSEKSGSPSTSSSTPVTGSSCRKPGSPYAVDTKVSLSSYTHHPPISMPTITLERVKLEKLKSIPFKDSNFKNSPITSSGRQSQGESVKTDQKHTSVLHNPLRHCISETGSTPSSNFSQSPLLEREASEGRRKLVNKEDPIDVELDLDLSLELDLDLTQSSQSSEEEQLLSLQEMMERVTKPPDTPEKGAFSEPSTPGHHSCLPKTQPLASTAKSGNYKNNLDQMLKEIHNNKKAKEIEAQLLTACKEDLQRIAEYEEAEENREEGVNTEQQEFLQRYSLMSNAIREVPPGEMVFNLEKFGCIFNQNSLELRKCMVDPQGTAQKTLLWSSPAQLRLHLNIGLFQEAYNSRSPCPSQVTRFLFKMMSVHSERMVSEKILQALCDIACTAAYQIVKNGSQQFTVWVPSLDDVARVLMNMGAAFVTLFPFENLQPPFTEGDLLEDIYIKKESSSSDKEQSSFSEHNCNNILKYLSYCMGLCPRVYTDDELLLLLTVVGRVGLDTRLILQSSVELYPLQYKIVNNIRDWDTMLPRICLALTDLTDDHHNMCLLVQLLPDNTRGKQLRRHLSLSMISKLLDGSCTYRPTEAEFQLSELRPYLPRMQPSAILRSMLSSSSRNRTDKEEDAASPDQQSYYLCYSLLTLANEASNFQFFPAHQKKQLLFLCSELETHVKCDIRESEKQLYRSKVKDLVARISTKWTMLLQRTRPLHGQLYDYWQPLAGDTVTSSQEEQQMDSSGEGEEPVTEGDEDEEETSENEDVIMTAEEEEEGDDTMDDTDKTGDDMKPEEMEEDDTTEDTKETEEVTETIYGLNQEMPHVHERIEAENTGRTEADTANLVETKEMSHYNQVAVCDLVS